MQAQENAGKPQAWRAFGYAVAAAVLAVAAILLVMLYNVFVRHSGHRSLGQEWNYVFHSLVTFPLIAGLVVFLLNLGTEDQPGPVPTELDEHQGT